MPKNLLIVESPAKAKTIEKILGKDYKVKSSFGHVRDLDKGEGAVDIENNFNPKYVISPEKRKVVKELKAEMKKADEVWLATDEDREGEAISWHLCEVLGLDTSSTKRIVFREITAPAIKKAIQQPRTVDINLVNAQQARRVLDRLVGYELSGLLWKKVRGRLSAGRVQSVAVKLVVEREKEIQAFKPNAFFKAVAIFLVENEQGKLIELKAEAPGRFENGARAKEFLKECINADYTIGKIEKKPLKRRPTAPFTTSTLQQEASRKLGYSVKRTMVVAQRLYEAGHVTYMRTDSISLSETALSAIAQEITKEYGTEYLKTRRFKNKKGNSQEAHEAIRPTYIERHVVNGESDEKRLYDLIWKRTIASQMAEAELEKTLVNIEISTVPDKYLRAEGEVLKFDGFLKVYLEGKDDDEDEDAKGILPPLRIGQKLDLQDMTASERFTRAPARYTEAALVKALEENGIGRPSTYAPTISKIMDPNRGYVIKDVREGYDREYQVLTLKNGTISEEKKTERTGVVKNRLFPTEIGITVSDFLDENFEEVMDYKFTADIEEKFDNVAAGKEDWTKMLDLFYTPFHAQVEDITENADRVSRERILGKDPESGYTLLTRLSRNGPVIQIGTPDELQEGEKPRYANFPPGVSMDEIEFDQAIKLFNFPKDLGKVDAEDVSIGVGRFGPYVKYGAKYISIPKGEDPHTVDMDRAKELIAEYKIANAPIATLKGEPITKGKGRFGPFVKWKSTYANVGRKYDFDSLTAGEAIEIMEAKLEKEANRYIHRWEDLKLSVENGRWGPFIRFGKNSIKLPKVNDKRMTSEEAKELSLEDVKELVEAEIPKAFEKKKRAPKKKTTKTTKKK